jgi:hypothetical protein
MARSSGEGRHDPLRPRILFLELAHSVGYAALRVIPDGIIPAYSFFQEYCAAWPIPFSPKSPCDF